MGPPAGRVGELLDDLVAYVNRADGDPLVRAAIAHAQFETIHPFPDGNGRTGRALIQYMLLREGLIGQGTLPVSSALMLETARYFDALDAFRVICAPDDAARSRAAQPWIELLAEATLHACVLLERLNAHVEALQQRWAAQAATHRIRRSSAAFRLLGHLPANPVMTASSARQLLQTNERTARHAVARLADAGILEQRSAGRRNRVFESRDMMDAFTESAREQPAANLTLLTPADALDRVPPATAADPTASLRPLASHAPRRAAMQPTARQCRLPARGASVRIPCTPARSSSLPSSSPAADRAAAAAGRPPRAPGSAGGRPLTRALHPRL